MHCFSSEEILNKQNSNCMAINGGQAIRMPKKGKNTLQLQNHHRQMSVPFVIYADFAAITERIQGCQPGNAKSYTDKYQTHTSCSYGYKVVCCYDDKIYKTGKDLRRRGANKKTYARDAAAGRISLEDCCSKI